MLHSAGNKRGTPHLYLDDLAKYAVDWRGVSEADLLGQGIGNSDPLPFDQEVWRLAVADNLVWFGAAIEGLLGAITKRLTASAEAQGNSAATSTPNPAATTVATS